MTFVTGTTLNGESTAVGYANNYAPAAAATNCTGALSPGFDKVYAVAIGAGQRLTATASPVAPTAGANPSLYLLSAIASCVAAPAACVAGSDRGGAGVDETLVFINSTMAATMFLVVDTSSSANPSMAYNLTVTLDTPPSAGDTCQAPNVLSTTTLTAQTTAGYTDQYFGPGTNCAAANGGPDRVYSLSIPVGQRATVTVSPSGGFDPSVSLVGSSGSCNPPRTCLDGTDLGGAGAAEVIAAINKGTSASTVFVLVDSAAVAGGFSIGAVFAATGTGDFCGNAGTAITTSGTIGGLTTAGYTNDYRTGTACAPSAGVDRAHAVTIPMGQRLTATVHPLSVWNPSMSLVAGPATSCETVPRTCIVSADQFGAGGDETIFYDNSTATAQTLFLIIDSLDPIGAGTYELLINIAVPPMIPSGDTCGNAMIAFPGLYSHTTAGYTNDYSPTANGTNCTGYIEPGPDRVYIVNVGPGKTLTATVAPTSLADPAIYILGSLAACVPSPTVCLAGDDDAGGGFIESVSYTNSGVNPVNVYVVIDTDAPSTFTYDLTISIP